MSPVLPYEVIYELVDFVYIISWYGIGKGNVVDFAHHVGACNVSSPYWT